MIPAVSLLTALLETRVWAHDGRWPPMLSLRLGLIVEETRT